MRALIILAVLAPPLLVSTNALHALMAIPFLIVAARPEAER